MTDYKERVLKRIEDANEFTSREEINEIYRDRFEYGDHISTRFQFKKVTIPLSNEDVEIVNKEFDKKINILYRKSIETHFNDL